MESIKPSTGLPRLETSYKHEDGFTYEWWHVSEDPKRFEYRIPNTSMAVHEEDLPNYGACYSWTCSICGPDFGGHAAQVGVSRRLADAWTHWTERHTKAQLQLIPRADHAPSTADVAAAYAIVQGAAKREERAKAFNAWLTKMQEGVMKDARITTMAGVTRIIHVLKDEYIKQPSSTAVLDELFMRLLELQEED